jgi:hypothetical protein
MGTVRRAVVVSGSPGLASGAEAAARATRDDSLAAALAMGGTAAFVEAWYRGALWDSLRRRPGFARVAERRRCGDSVKLAAALAAMSPGRQAPLWAQVASVEPHRLLLVRNLTNILTLSPNPHPHPHPNPNPLTLIPGGGSAGLQVRTGGAADGGGQRRLQPGRGEDARGGGGGRGARRA